MGTLHLRHRQGDAEAGRSREGLQHCLRRRCAPRCRYVVECRYGELLRLRSERHLRRQQGVTVGHGSRRTGHRAQLLRCQLRYHGPVCFCLRKGRLPDASRLPQPRVRVLPLQARRLSSGIARQRGEAPAGWLALQRPPQLLRERCEAHCRQASGGQVRDPARLHMGAA